MSKIKFKCQDGSIYFDFVSDKFEIDQGCDIVFPTIEFPFSAGLCSNCMLRATTSSSGKYMSIGRIAIWIARTFWV